MVRGHPRSSAMSPFDRARYDFLFVFNRNYASILYRFRDTASYLWKFADFTLPPPPFGGPVESSCSNFGKIFGIRKLNFLGYRVALFA